MTTTLRVVLDQLVAPTDPDLAMASRELTRALIATAPRGCEVSAAVPAANDTGLAAVRGIDGIAGVEPSPIPRRELATALSLGLPSGLGSGMLHSPTLFAPLVRHDRVHRSEQTVVTIWDLTPWTHPETLPKATVAWHRAMLKRAERHADAVVVPLHAMAAELAERSTLGARLRVISGAAPAGFGPPRDAVGRRRALGVPEGAVVIDGAGVENSHAVAVVDALVANGSSVVLWVPQERAPQVPAAVAVVPAELGDGDRASILATAAAFVRLDTRPAYPWRVIEALTLGTPVVTARSAVVEETVVDGGIIVESSPAALAAAVRDVVHAEDSSLRAATLASDRGRAFSWSEAAERVWQLHAEL